MSSPDIHHESISYVSISINQLSISINQLSISIKFWWSKINTPSINHGSTINWQPRINVIWWLMKIVVVHLNRNKWLLKWYPPMNGTMSFDHLGDLGALTLSFCFDPGLLLHVMVRDMIQKCDTTKWYWEYSDWRIIWIRLTATINLVEDVQAILYADESLSSDFGRGGQDPICAVTIEPGSKLQEAYSEYQVTSGIWRPMVVTDVTCN